MVANMATSANAALGGSAQENLPRTQFLGRITATKAERLNSEAVNGIISDAFIVTALKKPSVFQSKNFLIINSPPNCIE